MAGPLTNLDLARLLAERARELELAERETERAAQPQQGPQVRMAELLATTAAQKEHQERQSL